jgi:crossover junction endodeoxyribonuclease RusA
MGAPLDVDNMIKPIQDSLVGLVYADDGQVTDAVGKKRKLDGSFRVKGMSTVLAEGFCRGVEFLHICVDNAPDHQELN